MQTILRTALALAAFATLASCESAPPLAPGEGPLPPDGARYATALFPAPANFTATGTGNGSPAVVLSWEDVPGDQGYLVQWRKGEAGTWKSLASTGVNRTTYATDSLSHSEPNYYRVAVFTADFRAGAFSTVPLAPRVTMQPAMLPADSLADLRATLETYGSAATYWFQWGTDSLLAGAAQTPVRLVGVTAGTIAERVTVVPGTTYYFRAVASNAGGAAVQGPIRRFSAGAPEAPRGVTAAFSAAPLPNPNPHGNPLPPHHVHVQWTHDGNDFRDFRVQRRLVGAANWVDVPHDDAFHIGPGNRVDKGVPVTEDHQYDYRVLACDAPEHCGTSAEVRVATQGLPAPARFTATRLSDGRVGLTWRDVPNRESFLVQWRADETGGSWQTLTSTWPHATSYSYVTDRVGAGATYRVAGEVRSSRTGAFSEASVAADAEPLRAHTGGFTVPSLTSAAVSATVTPNGLATAAWIEWGTDSTFTYVAWTPLRSLGAGTSPISFTDTLAVTPGRTYYYRAIAGNGLEMVRGSRQSFRSGGPSAPTAAAAFDLPNYRIVVSWTHDGVGTPTRFRVDRRTTGLTAWTQVKDIDVSQPRVYLDVSFPANAARTYDYRVRACNAAGECSASGLVRAQTRPLAAPAGLTAVRAANGQVTVSWEDIIGEAAFAVQWRTDPAAPWKHLVSTGPNRTSYTTSSVTPGVTNYYRVAGEASGFRQGIFTQPAAVAP